jgi:hypothetical protein
MMREQQRHGAVREERGAGVERVRERIAAEEADRLERGVCLCGCEEPIVRPRSGNGRRHYVNERHRDRRYRERVRREAEAAGVPVRQTRETLDSSNDPGARRTDAQRAGKRRPARRREGVSIYLPSLEVAESVHALLGAVVGTAGVAQLELEPAVAAFARAIGRRRERPASEGRRQQGVSS